MKPPTRLPFRPDMVEAIKAGKKTCTSRTKRYGRAGDVLDSDAGPLRLTKVYRENLPLVAKDLHQAEGFDTPEAFSRVWREIHPRTANCLYAQDRFDWLNLPDQRVWVHEFERVLDYSRCPSCGSGEPVTSTDLQEYANATQVQR